MLTLENRGGRLVAVDDAGNLLPVPFGETEIEELNGVEQIQDASDLPDPVNGYHQLENKLYVFIGIVESSAGIELGELSPLLGHQREHCWFIHTGGGTAIKGQDADVVVSDMSLNAPAGTVIDAEGTTDTNFSVKDCHIADDQERGAIANLGSLIGFPEISFDTVGLRDFQSGLTIDGASGNVELSNVTIRGVTESGVRCVSFGSSFAADGVEISSGYIRNLQPDTEVFYVDPNATIDAAFRYRAMTHDTDTVARAHILAGAADPTQAPYWVSDSYPLRNSGVVGEVSLDSETTTTITTQNEWVEVTGTTTEGNEAQRAMGDGTGGIIYMGRKDTNVHVAMSVSWTGANGDIYEFAVGKNGTPEPTSSLPQAGGGQNANQVTALTAIEDLTEGDTISLMVRNTSGTNDLTLSRYNINFLGS